MMNEIQTVLDDRVAKLSEMPTDDLDHLLYVLERTYIHALIEKGLRGGSQP
jgi:hypothetical protein